MKNGVSFILLALLFSTLPAQASSHRTLCWNRDCLSQGWTSIDLQTAKFTDSACYREGCAASGWISGGTSGLNTYTQCKAGGCFTEGWYELDRQTQTLLKNVVCGDLNGDRNCLTGGWSSFSNASREFTTCRENDCRTQGWITQNHLGATAVSTCLGDGCFTDGWISQH